MSGKFLFISVRAISMTSCFSKVTLGVNRWFGFAKRVIEVGRPQKFGRVIKAIQTSHRHFDRTPVWRDSDTGGNIR